MTDENQLPQGWSKWSRFPTGWNPVKEDVWAYMAPKERKLWRQDQWRENGGDGEVPTFEPTPLFFYGSLTVPAVLKRVLGLREEPVLRKAYITGFKIKLWGPYPALVPLSPDDTLNIVSGAVYTVQTEDHLERLISYETKNYRLVSGPIKLTDSEPEGSNEIAGMTFIWNSDPETL
ncbi:hypothetical protein TWF694_000447 [Orbilia ellipsospora]|uniref:Putative gamma-glutamylcyclotransferase n=1 Tax=Orbilia ellipsospora TaxID=2528407 RepID=A0AAV9XS01_9PEZI